MNDQIEPFRNPGREYSTWMLTFHKENMQFGHIVMVLLDNPNTDISKTMVMMKSHLGVYLIQYFS